MKITLKAVASRWILSAETPCDALDDLVGELVNAGIAVESFLPRASYRLSGSQAMFEALASEVQPLGLTLEPDAPITGPVVLAAASRLDAADHYGVQVLGERGGYAVARAIDLNLRASPGGIGRWIVSGHPDDLNKWTRSLGSGYALNLAVLPRSGTSREPS